MDWCFGRPLTSHDYPFLMGFTLVVGVATVLGNLIADLLYTVVILECDMLNLTPATKPARRP